ncbi:MAG: EpsG family protein [Limnobacter sp.]|nr:EpsG family protein [Limnobacter sp.]
MIYYSMLMAFVFGMGALKNDRINARDDEPIWKFAFVLLVFFIGFRHHVGMDWNNYLAQFERVKGEHFSQVFDYTEWLYYLTMHIANYLGFDIHVANLISSTVFCIGLFAFCNSLPNRWAGLLAALPLCVFTFAMSANRQAMAAGILLYLVAHWYQYGVFRRLVFIGLASLCHTSAMLMTLFVILELRKSVYIKLGLAAALFAAAYLSAETMDRFEYYDKLYGLRGGDDQRKVVEASGALAHLLFNAGPGLMIVISWLRGGWARGLNRLLLCMALFSVALIPGAMVASTAISRISMYLFPVSVCFFGCIPIWAKTKSSSQFVYLGAGVFLIAVAVFWFYFSNSGFAYINYSNYLFISSETE